jgi:hypothetical protein
MEAAASSETSVFATLRRVLSEQAVVPTCYKF